MAVYTFTNKLYIQVMLGVCMGCLVVHQHIYIVCHYVIKLFLVENEINIYTEIKINHICLDISLTL